MVVGNTYSWTSNPGNFTSTASNPTVSPTITTTYTLTETITATNCQKTNTVVITVNPLPAANTGSNKPICTGTSTNIGAALVVGNTYSWTSNPGSFTSTASNPTVTPTITTTYTLTETITATGCQKTNSVVITVNQPPNATATTADVTEFCNGGSALLTANTGTGLSYQWKLNGNDIPGATTSKYSATIAGSFTVVVSNSQNCSSTSTPPIITSIVELPPNSIIVFGENTICQGDTAWLGVSASDIYTYQWNLDTHPIIGANSPVFSATLQGSYTVDIIDDAGCFDTSEPVIITVNALPNAVITPAGSTTFCQGGSVILNANTGSGLTYQWKNASGNIPGATNSSYTANTNGSYTVYESSALCRFAASNSSPLVVTVNPLPASIITAGGPTTLCQGGSVILNANTGAGLTYQWKNGAGNISGATNSSYSANATGNYTVNITVSPSGCSKLSNSLSVTVNPLPNANTGTNKVICLNVPTSIGATEVVGNTYSWTSNPSGFTSVVSNPTVNPTVNTTYTLTETITATGCQKTNSVTVTVNSLPTANTGSDNNICIGKSTSIGTTEVVGNTYKWTSNPEGFNSILSNPSVNPTVSTTYILTETITATGCEKTNSVLITVKQLPDAINSAAGSATFCFGDSVVLNANTGINMVYQWQKNNSDIPGATTSSLNIKSDGSYSFIITDNNTTCSETSNSIVTTVNPLPSVTINRSGALTLCQMDSIILDANSTTASIFQWQKNGVDIPDAIDTAYVVNQNGVYLVKVTNSCGTAYSDVANIRVKPLPTVNLGKDDTICKNQHVILDAGIGYESYKWSNLATTQTIKVDTTNIGFGKFTFSVTVTDSLGCSGSDSVIVTINDCLGISEVRQQISEIQVFPNPNDGLFYLTINQPSAKAVKVYLFNIEGQEIKSYMLKNENGKFNKRFDISEYAKGVYILKIESNLAIEYRKILYK